MFCYLTDYEGFVLKKVVLLQMRHLSLFSSLLIFGLQGPSLNDAHILGLAAFVIHLSESRALIPEVEANFGISQPVPEKVLSLSEYWNCLLACRTKESLVFCMR